MTMTEMKKYDYTTINKVRPVADRLPNLDEDDENWALSHQQLSWCHGFMDNHNDGQTFYMKSRGIHLQRINEAGARCIAIVDHPYCYEALALLLRSFDRAGIALQVDPYTVAMPYEEPIEEEVVEEPGLEVA